MSLAAKMDIFLADVKKRKSTVMICALNGAPFSPPFLLPSRDPRGQHKCANEVSTYLATARGKLAPLPSVPPLLPLARRGVDTVSVQLDPLPAVAAAAGR